nr:GNAT family N-acetyltransferase [Patulibacter sp. SYSU D01012]
MAQQHDAREQGYAAAHPDRDDLVIEVAGRAVGRLLLARGRDDHRVVDVALLPDARGRGTGTAVLRRAQAGAAAAAVPLRLHADRGGPAEALYRRLGFVDDGVPDAFRVPLVWRP